MRWSLHYCAFRLAAAIAGYDRDNYELLASTRQVAVSANRCGLVKSWFSPFKKRGRTNYLLVRPQGDTLVIAVY